MPAVEITHIEKSRGDRLLGGLWLDIPLAGQSFDSYAVQVVGWVIGARRPVCRVRISSKDVLTAETLVQELRDDVAAAYPRIRWAGTAGFATAISVRGLPEKFEFQLEAVFEDGCCCPLATIHGRHQPLPTGCVPRVQPIFVVAESKKGTDRLMPAVEISHIAKARRSDVLSGLWLDIPAAGQVFDSYAVQVVGWAVGSQRPVSRVRIWSKDLVVGEALVQELRDDVAAVDPQIPWAGTSGFATAISVLGLPETFEFQVEAVFEDDSSCPLATIRGRHRPLQTGYDPRFQPIFVTSLGRTGTTWLMQILSHHPEIVAYRSHPYEVWYGRYSLHQLKVNARPTDRCTSAAYHFFDDLRQSGSNPFYDFPLLREPAMDHWLGRERPQQLGQFCQASIDSFYARVAESQGQPRARFFVEKTLPDSTPRLAWELYEGTKEVFLVRDFRDVACSIQAFNAKRGTNEFGQQSARNDEEFFVGLGGSASRLLADWQQRRDRAHLVRYEDLAGQPEPTLHALFDYLGLEHSPALMREVLAGASQESGEMREHRTSQDLSSSVGRWRTDLSGPQQQLCREVFRDVLAGFGYDAR
ncbi:MAG: sulfotransferase [Thermoguttaceae bacterium]